MEYKKYERDNYNIHLVKTNRFKSIDLVICFTKKYENKDIPFNYLLTRNMIYSSKKYNTKSKYITAIEDLYDLDVVVGNDVFGNVVRTSFAMNFLNPKYTNDSYYNDSVDFLFETLLNPNVKNGSFDEEIFNMCKNVACSEINNIKINPSSYAEREYSRIMFKGTANERGLTPTIEELDKVNPKNLYTFYKKLFKGQYKIDIMLFGETDESKLEYIENKIKNVLGSKKQLDVISKLKVRNKPIVKTDVLPFNQSVLKLGYNLVDMTDHEIKHILRVYITILGKMNDSILFNVVREKNSLCYSIGANLSTFSPSFTISTGINKENYEKTVKLIKKCVKSMSDKKVVSRLFKASKKTLNTFLNNYYDDAYGQMSHYYNKEIVGEEDIESLREFLNNVTIDEVVKLNEKIKLSTIYFLKGDN